MAHRPSCVNLLARSAASLDRHAIHPSPSLVALAVRDAKAATDLEPNLPGAWLALFSAHVAAGDNQAAAAALDEGLHHCPRDHALRFARASLAKAPSAEVDAALDSEEASASVATEEGSEALLLAAESSLAEGAFQDAIAKYSIIVDREIGEEAPLSYLHALRGRSDAWLRKGRQAEDDDTCFERAAADAKRLVETCPTWEEGWLWLGVAHLENGCPARARGAFRKGLEACPGSTRLKEWLKDAEMVIRSEGAESDCSAESDNEEDAFDASGHSGDEGGGGGSVSRRGSQRASEGSERMRDRERVEREGERSSERLVSSTRGLREPTARRTLSSLLRLRGESLGQMPQLAAAMERQREGDRVEEGEGTRPRREGRGMERSASERTIRRSKGLIRRVSGLGMGERGRGRQSSRLGEAREHGRREREQRGEGGEGSSTFRKEQTLYELLDVPQDAPQASIKGAYYKLARKYHPDKNQNDEQAKVKFQKLAEAYRVLSDPESRAVYDKYGDKGLMKNREPVMDPAALFAMVFGSDKFVHLIGQLSLATVASTVDEDGNTTSSEALDRIQKERVGKLAVEMLKTLKPWVDGDKRGFMKRVHGEMRRLRKASFGPSLLHTVGSVYVQHTTYLLDKTRPLKQLSAMMRRATHRSHRIATQQRAMNAAGRVVDKQRRLHEEVRRREPMSMSFEEAMAREQEMAEKAIDMMWKISVVDIESTLEEMLDIVLSGRDLVAEEQVEGEDEDRSRGWLRIGSPAKPNPKVGFVRPLGPMQHGQKARTRQQVLSERAYGVLAMGRAFKSALR